MALCSALQRFMSLTGGSSARRLGSRRPYDFNLT
jgi:hypothetical protein